MVPMVWCLAPAALEASEVDDLPGSALPPAQRIDLAIEMVADSAKLFDVYRMVHSIGPDELKGLPYAARRRYAWLRCHVAYELSDHAEERAGADQMFALYEETGDPLAEMNGRYHRALGTLVDPDRLQNGSSAIEDLRIVAERAEEAGYPKIAFLARMNLGKLLTGEEAAREMQAAEDIARELPQQWYLYRVRCEIARQVARRDPAAGDALLRSAVEEYTRAEGDPWSIYGWQARLDVVWSARPRPEAIEYSLDLLDGIEAHRQGQGGEGTGRAGFFSSWVQAYRRVAGLLLQDEAERADVEMAFALSEKMRGRVLLDHLERSGTGCTGSQPEAAARRAALRDEIAARQRALRTSAEADAGPLRREIEGLMLAEEGVERGARCQEPASFIGLPELEGLLRDDEAMLIFLIGGWTDPFGSFDGGSWAFVVTSGNTRVVRLPDRLTLRFQRDALLGSIRSRDDSGAAAAVALHKDLLRDVVAGLPEQIEHLIVIPHGTIEGLPLAALRPAPGAPALIDRYRLSYFPSATLWARSRGEPGSERAGAIAIVDPALEEGWDRLWPQRDTLDLRPLAGARAEGRALARHLGAPATVLEGAAATEDAVKSADLEGAGLVAFAAHAVTDDRFPRRSAIVLAAGDDEQDGLLQPHEIAALPLDGAIVVLSACQSATGRAVEGEGLLSLARSFLQAGASAVVGNLWPSRDDEAAALFASVYRNLGAGRTLAESVRRAQLELRDEGAPQEAWAGVVVLGDGDARVPPGMRSRPGMAWAWGLVAIPVLLWALVRRSRSA